MKLIKLSDTHYVIVDDSEIENGDFMYQSFLKNPIVKSKYNSPNTNAKKITHSTEPLEDMGLNTSMGNQLGFVYIQPLLLSEVEEAINGYSVEKMAFDKYPKDENWKINSDNADKRPIWIEGFKAHQELVKDKLFTVEDMRKAFKAGVDWQEGGTILYPDEHGFIQSLLPKTEWEVEIDEQGKLKLI